MSRARSSKLQPSSSPQSTPTNTNKPDLKTQRAPKKSARKNVGRLKSRELLFVFVCLSHPTQAMTLAASGDEVAQEAAAECFCSAASFDGGRAVLGPVVESGVIFALMESKSQAARSAAARRV